MGGLELPRLARADRVERELDVLAQLRRRLRPAGLVVDQLVAAVRQLVDAVDAPAQQVRPQPERERALEPDRLGVLVLEALVVAQQRRRRLAAQLALLLGVAEAAAPPAGLEQPEQLGQRAGRRAAAVEALEHLVDEDPEALVERRLRRDPEHARELVLERARPVGLDVARRQHEPVAAAGAGTARATARRAARPPAPAARSSRSASSRYSSSAEVSKISRCSAVAACSSRALTSGSASATVSPPSRVRSISAESLSTSR